ncbi:hypothetical protein QFZ79_003368 [Arthrobacter sp. V4I6]|uniref:hypothetical protein n=1 Tax=Arthrobacter sp. V4I6 TaxID=3042281 RepID=UPI00278185EF|nr:hypothetical protein [Arthrobacter sp. V4I6]MDQ0820996.1 hypothetical protein [Arthrobacter sp. V1I7]MDQ0855257.1 hypothetical protein [Arthrobacter sp. V4I6]
MNEMPAEHQEPGRYELRIRGHLDTCWADWFGGLVLTREGDGTTILCGPVVDQAALHGLLAKVRDIGATLISVNFIDAPSPHDEIHGC